MTIYKMISYCDLRFNMMIKKKTTRKSSTD